MSLSRAGAILSLVAASVALSPSSEARADGHKFVFSAIGPGAGEGVVAVGGKVWIVVPTFELHYVRGISDRFDVFLRLNTLGILSLVDLGARFRVLGDADSGFSLAVKGGGTPFFFLVTIGDVGASGALAFAATPGLVASFGGRSTQFSLGFDLPFFLGGAAFADEGTTASTSTVILFGRPTATIEWPISAESNLYLQASAFIGFDSSADVLVAPILALGAAW